MNALCRARAIVRRVRGSTRHNGAQELAAAGGDERGAELQRTGSTGGPSIPGVEI